MARKIVFVGSHLGYPMESTPLGGGAMVGAQLIRHWAARASDWPDFELIALGSGPQAPVAGARYERVPSSAFEGREGGIVSLSELRYARFCRQFEKAATEWILSRRAEFPPSSTSVLINDISEGPDLARLAAAGYPIVSIWHVDVVDYFVKMYLKSRVSAPGLTRVFEGLSRLRLAGGLPDVLKLVFEKQSQVVRWSSAMILPSRGMVETLLNCYGGGAATREALSQRCRVIPWGAWREPFSEDEVRREEQRVRAQYQIGPQTRVLLTVSRVSPEKGLHFLLEAMSLLEKEPNALGADVCVLMCGAPAFMQGAAYLRKVRQAASRLSRVRVFFPGYLGPVQKQAFFRVGQLFVSPSVHESYGLNIAEALRAGLPVIAGDHSGARDLLHPDYGRIVSYARPEGAAAALADALRELLADPDLLTAMGRRARQAGAAMSFDTAAKSVFAAALEPLREPAWMKR